VLFQPTPGTTNMAPPVDVFINEWLADNTVTLDDPDEAGPNFEDWFELFNAGNEPADVSGFYLSDTLTNRTHWRIPAGTVIPANGYLLVWADGEPGQNGVSNHVDLHAGFQLARGGEALSLFTPGGMLVDQVSYGSQTNDVSQGRYPNGAPGANYTWFSRPTPRTANILSGGNHPPQIDAIPDRVIYPSQTFVFTVMATDVDTPAQRLTFRLESGPTGAVIDSATGVFQWTPPGPPGTNTVVVSVSDDGTPPQTTSGFFRLVVISPPQLRNITWNSGIEFTFSAIPGRRYTVDYKDRLDTSEWIPVSSNYENFVAIGEQVTIKDQPPGVLQRFYRIRVMP
jgi:hypothetical protein